MKIFLCSLVGQSLMSSKKHVKQETFLKSSCFSLTKWNSAFFITILYMVFYDCNTHLISYP